MLLTLNTAVVRLFFITGVATAPYASFRYVPGLVITAKISKAGAAFSNPHAGPTVLSDNGNGWYSIALDTFDTDTVGGLYYDLSWSGGAFRQGEFDEVVTALPGDPGQLTNAERDAVAAATLGLSNGVDVGVSLAHFAMAAAAVLAGKTNISGDTVVFRNWAETKSRVTVKSNVSGRYLVTFDFT